MLREVAVLAVVLLGACSGAGAAPPTVEIASSGASPRIVVATGSASAARRPAPSPEWLASDREGLERARRARLPRVVWARAAWSAASLQVERTVWNDARVAERLRGVVTVRLDLTNEDDPDSELLAQRYQLSSLPTALFFDAQGRQVAALRGAFDVEAALAALSRLAE